MANLTEPSASWSSVYQIETTDAPTGGSVGIANRHALQLMARTKYLKDRGLHVAGLDYAASGGAYGIVSADAGKIKKWLSGTGNVSIVVPKISSGTITEGDTVTIMNAQTDGDLILTPDFGSSDIFSDFFNNYTSYRIRPQCSVTLMNGGAEWVLMDQYESQITHGVGEIISYATARTTASARGMLLCNGSAVSRTTYASLFAVIGTAFGVGDGSTTFNLPNYPTSLGGVSIRYYIRY